MICPNCQSNNPDEAKFCNNCGQRLGEARPQAPVAAFERAERLAQDMEMRPIIWQARARAARVLATLGRAAEAEARRAAAQVMVAEIGGLFSQADLRENFLAQAGRVMA